MCKLYIYRSAAPQLLKLHQVLCRQLRVARKLVLRTSIVWYGMVWYSIVKYCSTGAFKGSIEASLANAIWRALQTCC